MDKGLEQFRKAVKLLTLLQCCLEYMDELKGTRLYRQDIKKTMHNLEKKIELAINKPINEMYNTSEDLSSLIQKGVEIVLDMDIDELASLENALTEVRTSQDE